MHGNHRNFHVLSPSFPTRRSSDLPKHSRDFNLCRESVMSAGLAPETAAYDLQMACGTGLQGAINIANKIALGQVESGIGGGVDTTSDAPIAVGDKLRKILLEVTIGREPV